MKAILSVVMCAAILLSGCAIVRNPDSVRKQYENQIIEWQQRQSAEGWNSGLIEDIVEDVVWMSSYKGEMKDHWNTYKESIDAGLFGDCEDTAVAAVGTLKRLGYPNKARIRIVTTMVPYLDHAVIAVQMPDGTEQWFDSVFSTFLDRVFYVKACDFDELTIN